MEAPVRIPMHLMGMPGGDIGVIKAARRQIADVSVDLVRIFVGQLKRVPLRRFSVRAPQVQVQKSVKPMSA